MYVYVYVSVNICLQIFSFHSHMLPFEIDMLLCALMISMQSIKLKNYEEEKVKTTRTLQDEYEVVSIVLPA